MNLAFLVCVRPGDIFWHDVTPCLNAELAEMNLSNVILSVLVCCKVQTRRVLKDIEL